MEKDLDYMFCSNYEMKSTFFRAALASFFTCVVIVLPVYFPTLQNFEVQQDSTFCLTMLHS